MIDSNVCIVRSYSVLCHSKLSTENVSVAVHTFSWQITHLHIFMHTFVQRSLIRYIQTYVWNPWNIFCAYTPMIHEATGLYQETIHPLILFLPLVEKVLVPTICPAVIELNTGYTLDMFHIYQGHIETNGQETNQLNDLYLFCKLK